MHLLPGAEYTYSEYDLGIIAEILTTAEHSAQTLARKGKGKTSRTWHASPVPTRRRLHTTQATAR